MGIGRLNSSAQKGFFAVFNLRSDQSATETSERGVLDLESTDLVFHRTEEPGLRISSVGLDADEHDKARAMIDGVSGLRDAAFEPELFSESFRRDFTNLLLPGAVVFAELTDTERLLVFRDAAGFIPVYYHSDEQRLALSSNLQSVREYAGFEGVNTDKINEMLVYAHRTGKRTLWQNVNAVSPGSVSLFDPASPPRHEWLLTQHCQYDESRKRVLRSLTEEQVMEEVELALDQSMASLENEPHVSVPCGGGVDSSLLGAYLARRGQKVTFWCINQPEAKINEKQWMDPLSRDLGIPVEYANLTREVFLTNLLTRLHQGHQPLIGPNVVGGIHARKLALEAGDRCFVSGEGADTVFGGLSPFSRLMPMVRLFRLLSFLPRRLRMQMYRGLISEESWIMDISQVAPAEDISRVAFGDLERAELLAEVQRFPSNDSAKERFADIFSWIQIKEVPTGLNHTFFEKDEFEGGVTHYPFATAEMINLGLHLPYKYKVNKGHKKWLWRKFASKYIGEHVAFRKKYGFPTLTHIWLEPAAALLKGGFIQNLLLADAYSVFMSLPKGDSSRWTLLNIELWGRLHIRNEDKDELLEKLLKFE